MVTVVGVENSSFLKLLFDSYEKLLKILEIITQHQTPTFQPLE